MFEKYTGQEEIGATGFTLSEEGGYLYKVDNELIGYVNLTFADEIWIHAFEVVEKHRNKGWGSKMITDLYTTMNVNSLRGITHEDELEFWCKQGKFEPLHDEEDTGIYYFRITKTSMDV